MITHTRSILAAAALAALSTLTTSAATRYVWQSSPSPAPPYTNWATAAHVIQHAVDAAPSGAANSCFGIVIATVTPSTLKPSGTATTH